jgi:hypothetical protein
MSQAVDGEHLDVTERVENDFAWYHACTAWS